MTPERKAIIGQPLTLQERINIHGLEIALVAKRLQQLEQDQADIMTAFAADRLPPTPPGPPRGRNAKGWDTPT